MARSAQRNENKKYPYTVKVTSHEPTGTIRTAAASFAHEKSVLLNTVY